MNFQVILFEVCLLLLTKLQFYEALTCNGVIVAGNACCGSQGYSTSSYTCCNGVIKAGNACCGSQGYSTSSYTCCSGVIVAGNA
ncbi:unnamed protein product, partial [Rotaria sp. Silwood2]